MGEDAQRDGLGEVLLLAADIGGTNSRFVLFRVEMSDTALNGGPMDHEPFTKVHAMSVKNEEYGKFKDVMQSFLNEAEKYLETTHLDVTCACLAVAGPVTNGRAAFTNRQWVIDEVEIQDWCGIKHVTVVNDFVASGYGIQTLTDDELVVLQEGKLKPEENGKYPKALLGAGTGLGECFLTPSKNLGRHFYDVFPTEGGHVEFAPKTDLQFRCMEFLQQRFSGRISVERIVSGKGLLNVYEFFKNDIPEQVNEVYDERIMSAKEAGAEIAALSYDYSLCTSAMEMVFEVYGTETGSVALKYLPYGGLYISGSLAPKNIERIRSQDSPFMKAALDKGRVSPTLTRVPIMVVMCEDLGMRGSQLVAYTTFFKSIQNGLVAGAEIEAPGGADHVDKLAVPTKYVSMSDMNGRLYRRTLDLGFVAEIAVASSIAASIALLIGFGARQIVRPN